MQNVTAPATFSPAALVSIRKGQGLTRSQLARKAELDRTQLWRVETGAAVPYDSTVGRLARALGIPVSALLTSEDAA
jgi:transcriptional regulator with XRE-family HTH domain